MAIGSMTSLKEDITCAGGIFLARSTQRFLFLLRAQGKTAGTWGIAGGKQEPEDSTLYEALQREIEEELGFKPAIDKAVPIEHYASRDDQFYYNTYVLLVQEEFIPRLNDEHVGYAWVGFDQWPKPLHQGVKTTLSSRTTRAKLETILAIIG
jgi:8-oxo-dGTP pyrophosphatase MutT (NUDIX family)